MLVVIVFVAVAVAAAVAVVGGLEMLAQGASQRMQDRARRRYPVILVALGGTIMALLPSSSSPVEDVRRQSILRADLAEVAPDTGFDEEQTFLSEERVEEALTYSNDTWYEDERSRALAAELKDRGYRVTIADPEMLRETYSVPDDEADAAEPLEPRRGLTGISLFGSD